MTSPQSRSLLSKCTDNTWQLLRRTPPMVFATAVFVCGIVAASSILVKGIRSSNDTITVTGASTERITSDYVDWSVNVKQTGYNQQTSYQLLKPSLEKTIVFLKANGVKPDEIELGTVRSNKDQVRNPKTGELLSTTWTTTQAVLIGSWDVKKIHMISGKISALNGEGYLFQLIDPPTLLQSLQPSELTCSQKLLVMHGNVQRLLPRKQARVLAQLPTPIPAHSRSQCLTLHK